MTELKHIAWPSIEGFHNIRKYFKQCPVESAKFDFPVPYSAKVKLHGTNAAVQCHDDGTVVAQSRETLLVAGADNAGFAKWVESTKEYWQRRAGSCFFGEWVGPGIQSGVAVNQLKRKVFAVFAMVDLETNQYTVSPTTLQLLCQDIPDVCVLPWTDFHFTINWKTDSDSFLEKITDSINKKVEEIEACDPWVKEVFGIEGVGEGLVFYPQVERHNYDPEVYQNLMFKAKGEKHRVVKAKAAATVNPETAASADAFVDMVVTEARLLQGVEKAAQGFDKKLTGAFVAWVLADVQKETESELQASGLTWKDVQKLITDKARKWYLAKS